MLLRCFGSGSSGNCYAIMSDDEILILDAGVRYKEVLKGIDYRISDVVGVIVTHGHKDHSYAVDDFQESGIEVYQPYLDGVPQSAKFGSFTVYAIEVSHDDEPCRAFLINVKGEYILYLTDLEYCEYTFEKYKPITIIVEANYDMQFVDKSVPNYHHIVKGHLSLENAINLINANKTDSLKNVILAHLSKNNSNKEYFISEVKKMAKIDNVCVAEKGIELEL